MISEDIRTVYTASDWLVASLGMVNIGYNINKKTFINVLSEQLEKFPHHLHYAILFSGASAERHNYRNRTTCMHRKR